VGVGRSSIRASVAIAVGVADSAEFVGGRTIVGDGVAEGELVAVAKIWAGPGVAVKTVGITTSPDGMLGVNPVQAARKINRMLVNTSLRIAWDSIPKPAAA